MKILVTILFLFGIGAQANSQDLNESARIKDLLSALDNKALEAKLQYEQLLSNYSKQHPKVKQYESQLKSISEAKAELASKLAMIELSSAHKELKNHASVLSKHVNAIENMMAAKVDNEFKSEYKKLHDQANRIIQRIEAHVDRKHKDVAKGLRDLFSKANVDPAIIAKEYDRAMFEGLSKALADRRDQTLVEFQQARIAQEKSESINKDLQSRINELEQRLAKKRNDADKQQHMGRSEKRKADEALSVFDDALRIADLEMKQFAANKIKMDKAINSAKSIRMTSKDVQSKKLDDLYIKLADVKNHSAKTTQSVDDRLKKVESDVGQIKSMLEQLVKRIK